MNDRFSLRFVLSAGRPTLEDLMALWAEEGPSLRRLDDGIVELLDGDDALARLDLLRADDARGRTLLQALRVEAARHADGEALSTIGFMLDHASGVVIARPVLSAEADIERALEPLDALWEHLFAAHGGVLQIDGEGFYAEEGPLVEV